MDPYSRIAELYDCEHDDVADDANFYLEAVQHGPVLEVGAGSGRITAPLARNGLEVWALDPSEHMLQRARTRLADLGNVHFWRGTISDLPASLRFGTVILPLNVLWHVESQAAQVATLAAVRAHLEATGTVIVDLTNPLSMADRGANGEVRLRFRRLCNGAAVTCSSAAWDEQAEQQLRLLLTYDQVEETGLVCRTETELDLRYLYCPELNLMLQLADFSVSHVYGSYNLEPYGVDSPNILAVAHVPSPVSGV